jgi:hypothetical protein
VVGRRRDFWWSDFDCAQPPIGQGFGICDLAFSLIFVRMSEAP